MFLQKPKMPQSALAVSASNWFLPRFPFLGLPFLKFIFSVNTSEVAQCGIWFACLIGSGNTVCPLCIAWPGASNSGVILLGASLLVICYSW